LPEGVIDLVGTGVEKVFAFEINFCAAEVGGEAFRKIEGCGAAYVVGEEVAEAGLEFGVLACLLIGCGEFLKRSHKGLRDEAASVGTKIAFGVGKRRLWWGLRRSERLHGINRGQDYDTNVSEKCEIEKRMALRVNWNRWAGVPVWLLSRRR
jgi:hypothetical protein